MLRLATLNDVSELNQLIQDSVRGLGQGDYSKEEIEAGLEYVFGVDTALIEDKTFYVIEKEGKLAACGGWSRRNKILGGNQHICGDVAYLNPEKDAAKIRAFFVSSKFPRQGLGKTLLQHCEEEASKQGFKRVEMMATLTGAKMYSTFEYQFDGEKVLVLPNQVSLKFMQMSKALKLVCVQKAVASVAGYFGRNIEKSVVEEPECLEREKKCKM